MPEIVPDPPLRGAHKKTFDKTLGGKALPTIPAFSRRLAAEGCGSIGNSGCCQGMKSLTFRSR